MKAHVLFKSGQAAMFEYKNIEMFETDKHDASAYMKNGGFFGSTEDGFIINALDVSAVQFIEN